MSQRTKPELELGQIYRTHITMIRQRCRRIVGDMAMADDIAQDVFVSYAESYSRGEPPAKVAALLYSMATNRAINALRDGKRRGQILAAEARSEGVVTSDAGLDVRKVLSHVDPELAAMAVYYYVDGMDQDEIAEVTGLHRRTVSRRLEAFRDEAQKALSKGGR